MHPHIPEKPRPLVEAFAATSPAGDASVNVWWSRKQTDTDESRLTESTIQSITFNHHKTMRISPITHLTDASYSELNIFCQGGHNSLEPVLGCGPCRLPVHKNDLRNKCPPLRSWGWARVEPQTSCNQSTTSTIAPLFTEIYNDEWGFQGVWCRWHHHQHLCGWLDETSNGVAMLVLNVILVIIVIIIILLLRALLFLLSPALATATLCGQLLILCSDVYYTALLFAQIRFPISARPSGEAWSIWGFLCYYCHYCCN